PVLVYSTYLGGSSLDEGLAVAVDDAGNAYVTGRTSSNNFPTTSGVVRPSFQGGYYDAFVTKLSADGSAALYSTYLGGSGDDSGRGIAVDNSGNAYITGLTTSGNFPIASPYQSANAGGTDVFVTKLNPNGTDFIYSTYLGGNGFDR